MDFPGLARFPWVPWIIALAALLIVVLSALAVRSRRRLWKVLLGLSAAVVLIGSCAGLGIVSLYHEPAMSVNRPAPVSDSLSLSFMQDLHGPNILTTLNARTGAMRWQHVVRASTRLSTADEHTLYLMEEETQSIFAVRASDGKELWRTLLHYPSETTTTHLHFTAPPVVLDGMLYFNVDASYYSSIAEIAVFALHAATGALAWTSVVNTANRIYQTQTIAVGRGMLFVVSYMGEVFALRASDGVHVWSQRSQSDEYLEGPPVFAGGVVYVIYPQRLRPSYKRIVALDARAGKQLWSQPLIGQESFAQLSIGATSIYLNIAETAEPKHVEYLYSLSAQTGQLQWKYQVTGTGRGITEAGNLVYFANGTYLDALRVSDGQRVWRYGTAPYYSAKKGECYYPSEFGAPAVADGVLLVKSTENCSREVVNAINSATGAMYWQIALESSTLSGLLLVTDDSAQ